MKKTIKALIPVTLCVMSLAAIFPIWYAAYNDGYGFIIMARTLGVVPCLFVLLLGCVTFIMTLLPADKNRQRLIVGGISAALLLIAEVLTFLLPAFFIDELWYNEGARHITAWYYISLAVLALFILSIMILWRSGSGSGSTRPK